MTYLHIHCHASSSNDSLVTASRAISGSYIKCRSITYIRVSPVLLLLIILNYKVRLWSGLKWNNINTKFREDLSTSLEDTDV